MGSKERIRGHLRKGGACFLGQEVIRASVKLHVLWGNSETLVGGCTMASHSGADHLGEACCKEIMKGFAGWFGLYPLEADKVGE